MIKLADEPRNRRRMEAVQTAQKNADELLRPYVEETALKRLA